MKITFERMIDRLSGDVSVQLAVDPAGKALLDAIATIARHRPAYIATRRAIETGDDLSLIHHQDACTAYNAAAATLIAALFPVEMSGAKPRPMPIRLHWLTGYVGELPQWDDGVDTTLDALLSLNTELADTRATIERELRVHGSYVGGGGAEAAWKIARVDPAPARKPDCVQAIDFAPDPEPERVA